MAQDLSKISLQQFRLQVPVMNRQALLNCFRDSLQWLRNYGDKLKVDMEKRQEDKTDKEILGELQLMDMLKKSSVVEHEMHRRGYTDDPEYAKWYQSLCNKLRRTYDV